MGNEAWLERLQMPCNRFSYLGIGADLAALSVAEAWGVYRFLSRMADG
jgi:hypothetical protein